MPHLITDACTACGACLDECPTRSILDGEKIYMIDADTCADHEACVAVCPVNAIQPIEVPDPQKPNSREKQRNA